MQAGSIYLASSLEHGLAALAERGDRGVALAGATWIMRAPIRRESLDGDFVAISRIEELRRIEADDRAIRIGACVTHAELAALLAPLPGCEALKSAAAQSANPAIRNFATLGGNLGAADFHASDLIPALLSLDAAVEVEWLGGKERLTLDDYLGRRGRLPAGSLVTHVVVPRCPGISAHVRLPLRRAGDYPVASLSIAAETDAGGILRGVRIAVGSVEAVARRWTHLETALKGRSMSPELAAELAEASVGDFQGRDGVEAPGWYRVKVLPSLVRKAFQSL
jgi:aerobic carbon-monoxide dehydrogenase medium subunit